MPARSTSPRQVRAQAGVRTRRVVATLALGLALAGCGTPPWQADKVTATPSTSVRTAPPSSTSVAPKPSATTPSASVAPVESDLAAGSAKRTLEAGGVRVKINYWSTLDMSDWTGSALKPLNLSASAKFIDGSKQNIFLSKVSVNVSVAGAKGPLVSPPMIVDASSLVPGYLIKSPSSYGQVFTIPALAAGATAVTLTITYELLVQSAPKAKTYSKQTASNDLTIPITA